MMFDDEFNQNSLDSLREHVGFMAMPVLMLVYFLIFITFVVTLIIVCIIKLVTQLWFWLLVLAAMVLYGGP